MTSGFSFFATRRFLPLFGTQFMGAFNDNLLRTAVVVLISYYGLSTAGLPAEQLVNLAAGVFILPFFLFSATAGKLAESFDKAAIARVVKLAEIGIMLLTGAGLFLHSAGLLMTALFLMGTHSTFFGPLKYSVLPQYLQGHELVAGNGLIEMGTFLAILFGQIIGSLMMHHGPLVASSVILATALCGYAFSRAMPSAPPTAQHLKLSFNVLADSTHLVGQAWQMREVRSAILGISWFWLMGAVYTTQLPTFTRLHLGGNADVYTLMLAIFSLGIGAGSLLCAKLSHGKLQLGLVLVGSLGMSVAGCDLALNALPRYQGALLDIAGFLQQAGHWRHMIDLAMLGFFGGFFTVPLYTWLQTASPEAFRSQAIAANNIINGFYMVAAALASALILGWLHSIALLFLLVSLANLLAIGLLVRGAPVIWRTRLAWLGR
ncbi:MFS transporter [Paludibacterium sp. THUN1379]|uniref:MFS transporter n=1 Tax=Paludibacterium sp. THUN1379 TaxID=3112107 RepID=UPI003085EEF8|nr:MFS transporter [Paludibacterium sp. THUN1379]